MKTYFKRQDHVFINLHPGSRAQVFNCHFQVLPRAKQNIPYFSFLTRKKNWYAERYSHFVVLLGYYM